MAAEKISCRRCRVEKWPSAFAVDRRNKTGREGRCKECKKRDTAASDDRRRFGGRREEAIKAGGEKCGDCDLTRVEHFKLYGQDLHVDHADGCGRHTAQPNNELSNLVVKCVICHGHKDGPRTTGTGYRPSYAAEAAAAEVPFA